MNRSRSTFSASPTKWRQSPLAVPLYTRTAQAVKRIADKAAAKARTRRLAWADVVTAKRAMVQNRCERCGKPPKPYDPTIGPLDGHHRLMKSQGGPDVIENCAILCTCCHGTIHGNPEHAYSTGWLVRKDSDEAGEIRELAKE